MAMGHFALDVSAAEETLARRGLNGVHATEAPTSFKLGWN
jgi:hypothetical protein